MWNQRRDSWRRVKGLDLTRAGERSGRDRTTRDRRGRVLAGSDSHPIHAAITREDTKEVRRLLDANPGLVDVGNEVGASPLHRAVGRGVHKLATLLLDRGANVHAVLSSARGLGGGFWTDLQAIDLAI